MSQCPCQSGLDYEKCCGPFHSGAKEAPTAEALMRARYSAFAKNDIDYIGRTHHPDTNDEFDREETEKWAKDSEWLGLEVLDTKQGTEKHIDGEVEFVAKYKVGGVQQNHHERAQFSKEDGKWYFVDGQIVQEQYRRVGPKIGRNDPCSCGSGKKFKKCCGK